MCHQRSEYFRLFMYVRNNKGLRVDPSGTQLVKFNFVDS